MSESTFCETVIIEGIRLEIIAEQLSENEWQLAVQNPLGIFSIWTEPFRSASEALNAGREAIDNEGLKGFFDTDGFEYLLQ